MLIIKKTTFKLPKKLLNIQKKIIYINLIFSKKSNHYLSKDLIFYGLTAFIKSNFIKDPKDKILVIDYCFF